MSALVYYRPDYFRTKTAILKFACLLFNFIGFLCILCSGVRLHNLRGCLYLSVTGTNFIITICLLLFAAFGLWERKFHKLSALNCELYISGGLALATFIAAAATCSMDVLAYSIATFFGFFAATVYAYEAHQCYCRSQMRDVATQTQVRFNAV